MGIECINYVGMAAYFPATLEPHSGALLRLFFVVVWTKLTLKLFGFRSVEWNGVNLHSSMVPEQLVD